MEVLYGQRFSAPKCPRSVRTSYTGLDKCKEVSGYGVVESYKILGR